VFLNRYLEVSGDYSGVAGLRFYLVYRALVRSKVWALTAQQESLHTNPSSNQQRATSYLQLASAIADGARPRLLLTCGFSGAGKSRLAEQLAQRLPAITIRSDVERKRMLHLTRDAATGSAVNQGAYTEAMTRRVYEICGQRAQAALADGWSVIIDAAALATWQRQSIREIARGMHVPFCVLHCQADPSVLEARVAQRKQRGGDPSEADLAVLHAQLSKPGSAPDTRTGPVITVRTDQAIHWAALIAAIDQATG
jgi:predicted kinase